MAEYSRTVTQLIDSALGRIRSNLGSSAELYDETLNFLNLTFQEISMWSQWRWLRKETEITTVDGTKVYNLPADCLAVRTINVDVDGNYRSIDLLEEDHAKIDYLDDTDKGGPEAYISGIYDISSTSVPPIKSIEIKPTPDAIYTLEVSYQSSIKNYGTGDVAEVPPVPTFLYPAVLEGTYSHLLEFVKNPRTEILAAKQNFITFLQKAIQFDRDQNKGVRAIRSRLEPYRKARYKV